MFFLAAMLTANPALAGHEHSSSHHVRPASKRSSGTLVIDNPLPIDVVVELPDGRSRHVEAHGSTRVVGVDLGHCVLVFRRKGGKVLQRKEVHIGAWSDNRVTVKAPTTGMLMVQNSLPYEVIVYIDGRQNTTLSAYGTRVIYLAPGDVRVDLVDARGHGGRIASNSVRIDRYQMVTVSAEQPRVASSTGHQRPR